MIVSDTHPFLIVDSFRNMVLFDFVIAISFFSDGRDHRAVKNKNRNDRNILIESRFKNGFPGKNNPINEMWKNTEYPLR